MTPSETVILRWATFAEAAEQAGLSRRFGGIHFLADDLVGRETGQGVADAVWDEAMGYILGLAQRNVQ